MTHNKISIAAGQPRILRWFITVSVLIILSILWITIERSRVESDLKDRVTAHLTDNNIDWISVELEGHDQDILLSGMAPTIKLRETAVQIVTSFVGARVVHDQLDIKTSQPSPALSIKQRNGKVLFSGRLASQESIDAIIRVARDTYGNDNVTNELAISDVVKEARWLTASIELLPALVRNRVVHLEITDHEILLTAEVKSHGERIILVTRTKRLLGKKLEQSIVVLEYTDEIQSAKSSGSVKIKPQALI